MRVLLAICLTLVSTLVFAVDDGAKLQPGNLFPKVKLETSMGDIVVELDRIKAPITSNNFLLYVDKRSYEDTIFHRVIKDFVVQGGGYDKEFNTKPVMKTIFNESGNGNKNEIYTLAMARENDPHSAGRQFFFNMNDNPSLDPGRKWGYAVFGRVVNGMEVLDKIAAVETHVDPTWGWPDVPKEPVILKKATLLPQEF
ncbi:peptidylprolyl isomerase [Bowmanella dokdonensis]|uniref:Peptidyl-prolyl cis-trans isomerase n=1 Tax=Bowmanella dokdonensis TaxID=751969 RepID=A0A939DMW2_9ALTE|nr:peptidylprolyl isomerase [Bowmanella dokdonensis]MBN7825530.1 peptidylprolyl isomerase [Bowmanella dokdonensis]